MQLYDVYLACGILLYMGGIFLFCSIFFGFPKKLLEGCDTDSKLEKRLFMVRIIGGLIVLCCLLLFILFFFEPLRNLPAYLAGKYVTKDGIRSGGRGLFGVLTLLVNVYMVYYCKDVVGIKKKEEGRRFSARVYTAICAILVPCMEMAIGCSSIVIVGSICRNHNPSAVIIWNCLLLVDLILSPLLVIVEMQKLTVDGGALIYCSFIKKYKGNVENIVRLELTTKAMAEGEAYDRLLVTMKDGTVLMINNMDMGVNMRFYELLKTSVEMNEVEIVDNMEKPEMQD